MLEWLLWIKWLVITAFSVCIILASKFVNFFEIDATYSLVLIGFFSLFQVFVPYSMFRSYYKTREAEVNLRSVSATIDDL